MPTIQQLEAALLKADRAGDERSARAIAAEIKRVRAAPAKEEPSAARSLGEGFLSGFETVVSKPGEWLTSGLAALGDPRSKKIVAGRERVNQMRQQRLTPYQKAHPNWFTGGKIAGEALATAPVAYATGGAIAAGGSKLAPYAPKVAQTVQRVGRAVQTGGIGTGRTAAETAALSRGARALQMGERMVGGAIAGGETAALTGQDVRGGAEFGAALPVLAKVFRLMGGKGLDVVRALTGGAGKAQAAQIIREALGENIDDARRLFAELSPDDQRLAANALVEAGIDARPFIALAEDVTSLRPNQRAAAEAAAMDEITGRIIPFAGGQTATQTRAATELGRKGVSAAMEPQRTATLERANMPGITVPAVDDFVSAIRQRADELSARARRLTFGAERAETSLGQMDDLGDAFDPTAVAKQRGVAGAMTQRGEDAALETIALRDRANMFEDAAASLAAEGRAPLRAAPLVARLRGMAGERQTRASNLQRRALTKLASDIERLADQNGMIDAFDLYQIRKSELNDVVDVLLGSRAQPASGVKEAASSKMMKARDLFDDMIEAASGGGWKDYLAKSQQGYAAVNRQELAGHALKLSKERPDEFVALMRGERPEVVEAIMGKGTGKYDIRQLAMEDPDMFAALNQSAAGLDVINRTAKMAGEGRKAATDIIGSEAPGLLRNFTRMALASIPHARIGAEAGEQALTSILRPRTKNVLADALLTPGGTRRAMEVYPNSINLDAIVSSLPAPVRNALAQNLNLRMNNAVPPSDTGY